MLAWQRELIFRVAHPLRLLQRAGFLSGFLRVPYASNLRVRVSPRSLFHSTTHLKPNSVAMLPQRQPNPRPIRRPNHLRALTPFPSQLGCQTNRYFPGAKKRKLELCFSAFYIDSIFNSAPPASAISKPKNPGNPFPAVPEIDPAIFLSSPTQPSPRKPTLVAPPSNSPSAACRFPTIAPTQPANPLQSFPAITYELPPGGGVPPLRLQRHCPSGMLHVAQCHSTAP
jgi:hypothetical protein